MNKLVLIALLGTITTYNAQGQNVNIQYNTNVSSNAYNPYNYQNPYNSPNNTYTNYYQQQSTCGNNNVSNDPIVSLIRVLLRNKANRNSNRNRNVCSCNSYNTCHSCKPQNNNRSRKRRSRWY